MLSRYRSSRSRRSISGAVGLLAQAAELGDEVVACAHQAAAGALGCAAAFHNPPGGPLADTQDVLQGAPVDQSFRDCLQRGDACGEAMNVKGHCWHGDLGGSGGTWTPIDAKPLKSTFQYRLTHFNMVCNGRCRWVFGARL